MPVREKIAWVVLIVSLVLYFNGGPSPGPLPPPVPPVPPVPPQPPAPIAVDSLHVLIVEETLDRPKLPKEQLAIFTGTEVRSWLDANAKWRIYDKDAPMQNDDKVWQDGMKVPRQGLPWVVIANKETGFSGPLPADGKALLELVQKYD